MEEIKIIPTARPYSSTFPIFWGSPPDIAAIAAWILEEEGNILVKKDKLYMAEAISFTYHTTINMLGTEDGLMEFLTSFTVIFSPEKPLQSDFDSKDWGRLTPPSRQEDVKLMRGYLFENKSYQYLKYDSAGFAAIKWWELWEVNQVNSDYISYNSKVSSCLWEVKMKNIVGSDLFFWTRHQQEYAFGLRSDKLVDCLN